MLHIYIFCTPMSDGHFKSDKCDGHLAMKHPAYTSSVEYNRTKLTAQYYLMALCCVKHWIVDNTSSDSLIRLIGSETLTAEAWGVIQHSDSDLGPCFTCTTLTARHISFTQWLHVSLLENSISQLFPVVNITSSVTKEQDKRDSCDFHGIDINPHIAHAYCN